MRLKSCSIAAVLAAMICLPPAQAAPPVVLVGKTGQGATVDLADDKGKVVLLFFWSTECAVCLDQLPEMRRNLDGWRGQDFVSFCNECVQFGGEGATSQNGNDRMASFRHKSEFSLIHVK